MACATIEDYEIDCNKDSLGGLEVIYIAIRGDIEGYTETAGAISAVNMKTGKKFFKFDLVKSTSNFTNTLTANAQTGTFFYAQAATLVMNKLKAATSALVDGLAQNSLVMITKDRNGEFIMLGRENGLDVSGGTAGSGTASGDRSGYEIQFTGEEKKMSHVSPAIIDDLLIPAA
jgi:hypothetical protein